MEDFAGWANPDANTTYVSSNYCRLECGALALKRLGLLVAMPLAFGVSRNPLASHSFAAPGHRGRGVECRLAYRQLNLFSPVDARCLQFTFAAACGHLFARDWHQRLEKTRVFEPTITLTPVRHRAPRILLSSAGHPFSAAPFLGHCFGPNSCVLQLRDFCFPGSALTPSLGSLP